MVTLYKYLETGRQWYSGSLDKWSYSSVRRCAAHTRAQFRRNVRHLVGQFVSAFCPVQTCVTLLMKLLMKASETSSKYSTKTRSLPGNRINFDNSDRESLQHKLLSFIVY